MQLITLLGIATLFNAIAPSLPRFNLPLRSRRVFHPVTKCCLSHVLTELYFHRGRAEDPHIGEHLQTQHKQSHGGILPDIRSPEKCNARGHQKSVSAPGCFLLWFSPGVVVKSRPL